MQPTRMFPVVPPAGRLQGVLCGCRRGLNSALRTSVYFPWNVQTERGQVWSLGPQAWLHNRGHSTRASQYWPKFLGFTRGVCSTGCTGRGRRGRNGGRSCSCVRYGEASNQHERAGKEQRLIPTWDQFNLIWNFSGFTFVCCTFFTFCSWADRLVI